MFNPRFVFQHFLKHLERIRPGWLPEFHLCRISVRSKCRKFRFKRGKEKDIEILSRINPSISFLSGQNFDWELFENFFEKFLRTFWEEWEFCENFENFVAKFSGRLPASDLWRGKNLDDWAQSTNRCFGQKLFWFWIIGSFWLHFFGYSRLTNSCVG